MGFTLTHKNGGRGGWARVVRKTRVELVAMTAIAVLNILRVVTPHVAFVALDPRFVRCEGVAHWLGQYTTTGAH